MRRARRMTLVRCALPLIFGCCLFVPAQHNPRASERTPYVLDTMLASLLEDHDLPGVAVAIVNADQIVAEGCAGVRKRGSGVQITRDDRWHLGSCTKAMTATLIAQLVAQERIDPAITIIDAFRMFADEIHPKFHHVTLDQLLSNRGGLPSEVPELWPRIFNGRSGDPRADRRALAKMLLRRDHGPNVGTYEYSNFGFAIAGHIVETITDTPWEELMQQVLFDPLSMESAGFGLPYRGPEVTEPWGHQASGTPVEPGPRVDNPPAIAPAGTVHATLRDWASFISAHLVGANGDATPLDLSPCAFRDLHRPRGQVDEHEDDGYAAGWVVTTRSWARGDADGNVGRVLTHSGSNTMYFSVVWMAPERNLAMLACTNQGGDKAAKHLDAIVAATLHRYLSGAFEKPASSGETRNKTRSASHR